MPSMPTSRLISVAATAVQCLLKVMLYPGVFSVAILCVLYGIAEYTFSAWYFTAGYYWRPSFPLSWRILFLSLFVVPALAFIHLFRLSFHHLVFAYQWWRRKPSPFSRSSAEYVTLPRNETNSLEDQGLDLEDISTDTPSKQRGFPLTWSLRFIFWLSILCISLWLLLHHRHPGDRRYLPLIETANAHPRREGYANKEKIFIAAMFYNNEDIIPYWSDSLVKVIHYLGEDNVFVSILESNSEDQSPALLRQLDDRLDAMNVPRRILTNDMAITKPAHVDAFQSIRFLSALRNRVLGPLVEKGGYDRVLFSNDIFIEPEAVAELLNTADGEYDMACGIDFGDHGLYDLWVIRDRQGRLPSGMWPYFFDPMDYEAMQNEAPVPVFTCWNGIVVFNADPVLPIHLRSNNTLSNDPLPFELPATHPAAHDPLQRGPSPALTPPIAFRSSAPGECFSSESFLLPYDFRRLFNLKRIVVNPRVIVAYKWRLYVYFKWFMRHPVLTWWIEKIYDGAWMHKGIQVIGDPKHVWKWDGADCQPWS